MHLFSLLFAPALLIQLFVASASASSSSSSASPDYLQPPDKDNVFIAIYIEHCGTNRGHSTGLLSLAFDAMSQMVSNHSSMLACRDWSPLIALQPLAMAQSFVAPPPPPQRTYRYKEKEFCSDDSGGRGTLDKTDQLMQDALVEQLTDREAEEIEAVVADTFIDIMRWRISPCVQSSDGRKRHFKEMHHPIFADYFSAPEKNRAKMVRYFQATIHVHSRVFKSATRPVHDGKASLAQ